MDGASFLHLLRDNVYMHTIHLLKQYYNNNMSVKRKTLRCAVGTLSGMLARCTLLHSLHSTPLPNIHICFLLLLCIFSLTNEYHHIFLR